MKAETFDYLVREFDSIKAALKEMEDVASGSYYRVTYFNGSDRYVSEPFAQFDAAATYFETIDKSCYPEVVMIVRMVD